MPLHYIMIAQELPNRNPYIHSVQVTPSEIRDTLEKMVRFQTMLNSAGQKSKVVRQKYCCEIYGEKVFYRTDLLVDQKQR